VTIPESGPSGARARFGPFHRLESPSQPGEIAGWQAASGELWGLPPRGSDRPKVKAYVGPLPGVAHGIEFYTNVEPDPGVPPFLAFWSGPREGVRVEGGYAKIEAVIVRWRTT
jgi:hypothetical protein